MQIVGVDGCPGDWIAVTWDVGAGLLTPGMHRTFSEVLGAHEDAACIGVDIPIGLSDNDARACDQAARSVLRFPRSTSVFSAPCRAALTARSFEEACALNSQARGKCVSRQLFGILPKIAEVDALMSPARQQRVVEVHPEVSFWAMHGRQPMRHNKKTPAGFAERRYLLRSVVTADGIPATRADARASAPYAGPDDFLDAIAVAWTARRDAEGDAGRLPEAPPVDGRGLRMEIVY